MPEAPTSEKREAPSKIARPQKTAQTARNLMTNLQIFHRLGGRQSEESKAQQDGLLHDLTSGKGGTTLPSNSRAFSRKLSLGFGNRGETAWDASATAGILKGKHATYYRARREREKCAKTKHPASLYTNHESLLPAPLYADVSFFAPSTTQYMYESGLQCNSFHSCTGPVALSLTVLNWCTRRGLSVWKWCVE